MSAARIGGRTRNQLPSMRIARRRCVRCSERAFTDRLQDALTNQPLTPELSPDSLPPPRAIALKGTACRRRSVHTPPPVRRAPRQCAGRRCTSSPPQRVPRAAGQRTSGASRPAHSRQPPGATSIAPAPLHWRACHGASHCSRAGLRVCNSWGQAHDLGWALQFAAMRRGACIARVNEA